MQRLDRIVGLIVVAAGAIFGLIVWRGDQVGLQIVERAPGPEAAGVSTLAQVRVRFEHPVVAAPDAAITLDPPVEGVVRTNGDALIFVPQTPLAPNTLYTVNLAAGIRSDQNRELLEPQSWSFRTGSVRAVYSTVNEQGFEQLYSAPVNFDPVQTGEATRLSDAASGVWDFTVSASGGEIVFSALNEDGTSDLWVVRPGASAAEMLVACEQAACSGASFSPDGRTLAFSRRNATGFGAPVISPPRLYLLDMATGATERVFADDQRLGFEPRWSPDGEWLSFLSPDLGGAGVLNRASDEVSFYATTTGEAPVWSPTENVFLLSEMLEEDERYEVHLYRIDPTIAPADAAKTDLSLIFIESQSEESGETIPVEDNSPAWSPDGEWIAFRRKEMAGPRESLGKQLWRMRADGSDAEPLTIAPEFDHGQPVWSPDGRYLLYHKFPLRGPDVTISVWVLDVETGEQVEIARPGQRPLWSP